MEGRLLRQVTVLDVMTGDKHVLDFFGTARLNQYCIQVDGRPWRVCGWSAAMALVRKSCVRFGKER